MRVAIVVGCNSYDSALLDQLDAAELDAKSMFNILTDNEQGGYSAEYSQLLLSPTLEEIKDAFRLKLIGHESVETFTFYFAGHGSVRSGGFYMLPRDTRDSSLALSAFSLSDLFRIIADVRPNQSNIVIDACEAGGLVADLTSILKPELLGDADTLSITLLATAAKDEGAGEESEGGIGTQAIVKCIKGEDFVQAHSPMLDLMEVGRHVAKRLKGTGQTPVVWGLNLSATSEFTTNRHFSEETSSSVRIFVKEWEAKSAKSLQAHAKSLWDLHTAIGSNWNASHAIVTLKKAFSALRDDPKILAGFARRVRISLMVKAEESQDLSRPFEVSSALAVALLQHSGNETIDQLASEIIDEVNILVAEMCDQFILDLESDDYALLEQGAGVGTLHTLPIRVTKMLAWSAIPVLCTAPGGQQYEASKNRFQKVVDLLLEMYTYSITPVSNLQTAGWSVSLAALRDLGLQDQEELLIGHLYNKLVRTQGRLLRENVEGDAILNYILAVDSNDYREAVYSIDRPSETLAVVLRCAHLAGLGELLDDDLWRLDGSGFTAYVPENYSNFDEPVVYGGHNYVWEVGNQVCRTRELEKDWPVIPNPKSAIERKLCLLSSLLYADRVPWFCFA
ncbi:hypothetical protein GM658_22700 [Pseudoduganella eburnea]|uniref:Peptidase C14 caspase domain-containing protein n=1 Tax=Massilia eburnea TaxID=1776165 RepID=A0A6L6QM22_9BURK|nr:hypothetical protein [Massilia eburnea]